MALAVPLAFLGRSGFSVRELATIAIAGMLVGWGPAEHVPTALIASLLVMGMVISRLPDGALIDRPKERDPAS